MNISPNVPKQNFNISNQYTNYNGIINNQLNTQIPRQINSGIDIQPYGSPIRQY